MKIVRVLVMVLLATGIFVSFNGCGDGKTQQVTDVILKNKDKIVQILGVGATQATELGLKKWAEKQPDAAKEAAAALSRNLSDKLIPYFNGGQLPSSAEVHEFINSSLFKDVNNEVKIGIVAAAAILDLYLPIPDSNTYLQPEHVEFIKAFLNGVAAGAKSFSEKSEPRSVTSRGVNVWIN